MPAICGFFYGVRKMPLPNILEFIGTNITQRKFQQAQEKLLQYLGLEVPTKTELNNAISTKAEQAYVDNALSSFQNGAIKTYPTLAAANADIANIALNTKVSVLSAVDGGDYYRATAGATTLTKSAYDPLTQAKDYSDEKTSLDGNETDITVLRDVNGKTALKVTKEGKVLIIGLESDITDHINKLNSKIYYSTSSSNIFEILDSNGLKTITQKPNGDLTLPNIGNLTTAINSLKSTQVNENEINLPSAHLAGKYSDRITTDGLAKTENTDYLLTASSVNALDIFPHTVSHVRIPAITRIQKNKYLLFFEARESLDDLGKNSQGVATITVDESANLASVSDVKVLHAAFIDTEDKLRTFMNACAVKLETGRIICLYVRRHGKAEHQLYKRYSDDDGATWSDFEDITSVKGSTGWNLLAPCSQGLVKRYGQHKGRIVFPLWTSGVGYGEAAFRAGYIYSDDNGETWKLGEFADYSTANEVQCAEDLNGDLLFSIRLENQSQPKILARLSDKTKTYNTVETNKSLTSAHIMSGLIQGDNTFDKTANKFQLTACKTLDRRTLLIHTSYDGGMNWITHELSSTTDTFVAYSCIENINEKFKFLLWECDYVTNFKYSIVSLSKLVD